MSLKYSDGMAELTETTSDILFSIYEVVCPECVNYNWPSRARYCARCKLNLEVSGFEQKVRKVGKDGKNS